MPLTDPRGWLCRAALGMVLAAVLVWACFGTVRVTVEAQGVLVRPGGVRTVAAPRAGVVCQLPAQAGERVAAGQELCRLAPTGGAGCDQPVHSPIAARVLDIPVHEGEAVEPGSPLVMLESPEVAPHAVLDVPADTGYQVRPRMEARLSRRVQTRGVLLIWAGGQCRPLPGFAVGDSRLAGRRMAGGPDVPR